MTSFGTAGPSGPAPVRPDALRAYSGGESRHTDSAAGMNNALLLQQAATYAPLANVKSSSSNAFDQAEASTSYPSIEAANGAYTLQQAVSGAGIPSFHSYVDRSSDHGSGPPGSHDEDVEDVHASIWNIAPRLSMSSAESSGGSEVKTPESVSAQPSWRSDDLAMKAAAADNHDPAVQRSVDTASPALFDMSEVARHPQGLAASGFEKANDIARVVNDPALVQAASSIDREKDSIHRSVTIKAKRPDSLLKLPSTSYQTDRTVTPSTSEPSTLRQGFPTVSSSDAAGNVLDGSLSDGESSSEPFRSPSSDAEDIYRFPSLGADAREGHGIIQAPPSTDSAILPPQSPPERSAASPDSWRSLLPEHDPYYARSEELTGRNSRAGSDALSPSVTLSSVRHSGAGTDGDDSSNRRWSHDSRKSTSSLPGPVAVLPGGGSWGSSSSLYDLDGTFNSSGSRAAFAPLQHNYNHSTRSLASPSITASIGGTAGEGLGRGAMGKIADMVTEQQKRHASFSTFDNRNAQNRAALHHAPFVHPDYMDDHNGGAKGRPVQAGQNTTSSAAASRASLDAATAANVGRMGIYQSITRSDDGRENWPSSRNSLQSLPSPSLPGSSFASSSGMKRTSTDASALANELQRRLPAALYDEPARLEDRHRPAVHVGSPPPSVVSTSMLESVQPDQDGGVTTTRTTTTTTTTTMTYTHQPVSEQQHAPSSASDHVLSPKSRPSTLSDPQYALGVPPSHQGATDLVRQMSASSGGNGSGNGADKPYEVSPLSPPTLPFLDSRPAPSSTDFGIETHATHYTLKTKLPGFSLDGITLATKHHHQLVIVADKWDESNGGHFERRINFGPDADLKSTRASFDGNLLKITVPRRKI